MATKQSTIDYLQDQLAAVPGISARKMFGEYALYCEGRVVALVCSDELFVKITAPGKAFVGQYYEEGLAYPGAKPSMHIGGDRLEERDWLCALIRLTADNVPLPKPKKART